MVGFSALVVSSISTASAWKTTIAASESLNCMMKTSAHRRGLKGTTTIEAVGYNDSEFVALRWPKAGERTGQLLDAMARGGIHGSATS